MAIISSFVNQQDLTRRVAGCPLRTMPPDEDEEACANCRFNLVAPGQGCIGCVVRTPVVVHDQALDSLRARSPGLHQQLTELMSSARRDPGGIVSAVAQEWLRLAQRWQALPTSGANDDAAALELAMVIARFAKAAIDLGEPVRILS